MRSGALVLGWFFLFPRGAAGASQKLECDPVVAQVAGRKILRSSLVRELLAASGEEAAWRILRRGLVCAEAERRGVSVTEAEIERRFQAERLAFETQRAQTTGKPSQPGDFNDHLRNTCRLSPAQYRAQVVKHALLIRKTILQDVQPTPGQLQDFFMQHRDLYDVPARYRAQQIYFNPHLKDLVHRKGAPERGARLSPGALRLAGLPEAEVERRWQAAEQRASAVLAKIAAGHSFEAMLAHSEDEAGAKEHGGDLGWFTESGPYEAAFVAGVKELQREGDVSRRPVRTGFGYHLIKLTGFIPGRQARFDEAQVQRRLGEDYLEHYLRERSEPWLQALQQAAGARIWRSRFWEPQRQGDQPHDPVVAEAGKLRVRRAELLRELFAGDADQALQRLIHAEAMADYAARRGITVSPEQVAAEYEADRQALVEDSPKGRRWAEVVRLRFGCTPTEYQEKLRQRLLIRAAVKKFLQPSPKELYLYFGENKGRYLIPARYQVKHILLRPNGRRSAGTVPPAAQASPEAWAAAEKRAREIYEDLCRPQPRNPFMVYAGLTEYSDDTREIVEEKQGDLPRFSYLGPRYLAAAGLPPEFLRAAAELRLGETSPPVRLEEGYALLQLAQRTPGKNGALLLSVRRLLVSPLGGRDGPAQEKPQEASPEQWEAALAQCRALQARLQAGADFGQMVREASHDPAHLRAREGRYCTFTVLPPTFHPTGPIPLEIMKAAVKLEAPGQITPPLRHADGFSIVRLESFTPQRAASFREAEAQVEQDFLNEYGAEYGELVLAEAMQQLRKEGKIEVFRERIAPPGEEPP